VPRRSSAAWAGWTPLRRYAGPARLYHPEHGLFLAPDPAGYADNPHPYAFAGHNPADFADPSGAEQTGGVADVLTGIGEALLAVGSGLLFEAVTGGHYTAWKGSTAVGEAVDRSIKAGENPGDTALAGFVAVTEQAVYHLLTSIESAVHEVEAGGSRGGARAVTLAGLEAAAIVPGSWLNLVEVFFGITRQAIPPRSFTSVEQLGEAIRRFIDGWNERCHLDQQGSDGVVGQQRSVT
jgi:hypothetical protein